MAARTASIHAAVGERIQAWAGEHHRDALDAAWAEITAGREDVALGDVDVQLIAAWIFNDRALSGGRTAAERYSRLDDLDAGERDIAARIAGARLGLMRVSRVAPGFWIDLEDRTRQDLVRVISHGVSAHTRPGDLIVARRMDGPPAPSLWGPVGFVSAETGPRLSALITARIDPLVSARNRRRSAGRCATRRWRSRSCCRPRCDSSSQSAERRRPRERQTPARRAARVHAD
jgi:hypothetical protein